jgi:hypothetical protein
MTRTSLALSALALTIGWSVAAQQAPVGYTDTPMQPNGKWHIHDPDRPQPTVVTPGGDEGPTTPPRATRRSSSAPATI